MKQEINNNDWVTNLTGENLLYALLGKVLYSELDKNWLQVLIDESVFSESPFGEEQKEIQKGIEKLQEWSLENKSGISDQSFLDLKADYTSLFVGVNKVLAPLWESVYFNDGRMVFQEETLKVRDWFRRFNLESEKIHKEPDDHLGLELTFIAHLAQLGLQALDNEDDSEFQRTLDAQRKFLTEHTLRWAFEWADLVEEFSKTTFYQGIGFLVRGALIETANMLDIDYSTEKKK